MVNGINKKYILLAVWFVLLGVLGIWMTHTSISGSDSTLPPKMPVLDTAKIAAQWPQVLTHTVTPPRGKADAPYTLVEFGDFQCPQCGKARPMIEAFVKSSGDKLNFAFVHRPFPIIHHWAIPAAEASEIAATNGKFWPMYEMLYTHQDDLEPGFYGDYAQKIGLNKLKFQDAFNSGQYAAKVDTATKFADSLGIQSTPTLLLHDNVHGTVTAYTGKDQMDQLFSSPPWTAAKTASTPKPK